MHSSYNYMGFEFNGSFRSFIFINNGMNNVRNTQYFNFNRLIIIITVI